MAAGDLTASTPTLVQGNSNIKAAVDALNLTATTDFIFVIPVEGRNDCYLVFKVERAAA